MASFSRAELVKQFRKELEDWSKNGETYHGKDSTHIQIASVDEMMSAIGYVPRRLPNYPEIKDGRFGYVSTRKFHPSHISLEEAVRMHNGASWLGNPFRKITSQQSFAMRNRIVNLVSLQRVKKYGLTAGLKAQTVWVQFCDVPEEA